MFAMAGIARTTKNIVPTGIAKAAGKKTLNSVIDGLKKSLKKGNWITIVCFVTCSVTKRKAREGRVIREPAKPLRFLPGRQVGKGTIEGVFDPQNSWLVQVRYTQSE